VKKKLWLLKGKGVREKRKRAQKVIGHLIRKKSFSTHREGGERADRKAE